MLRKLSLAFFLPILGLAIGCESGKIQEKTIEVKENGGLARAKQLLESYAKGQPLGSEVTSYQGIVDEVRQTDSARADALEKGFAELQKLKAGTAAKAKEILKQLEPQPRPNG